MLKKLIEEVFQSNLDLVKHGLVIFTWGNVSGIEREKGLVVIKPSGVSYDNMTLVLDLNGKIVEGKLKPSSDTATHLALYNAFPAIGGIVIPILPMPLHGRKPVMIFPTLELLMPIISRMLFPVPVK